MLPVALAACRVPVWLPLFSRPEQSAGRPCPPRCPPGKHNPYSPPHPVIRQQQQDGCDGFGLQQQGGWQAAGYPPPSRHMSLAEAGRTHPPPMSSRRGWWAHLGVEGVAVVPAKQRSSRQQAWEARGCRLGGSTAPRHAACAHPRAAPMHPPPPTHHHPAALTC